MGRLEKLIDIYIPRFENYKHPSDEDYRHFINCEIRNKGGLFECEQCKYVWDHWYGTNMPFNDRKR